MKQILLGFIICCGFTSISNAQKLSLGPNVGYGSAWIDNFKDKEFKSGYNVGLSLIYSTKSSFGIGADIKYSFEGGEREYGTTVPGVMANEDVDLNYVRVPIKAMWFFGKYGQKLRPKVALGPSFGFLVGGKDNLKYTNTTTAARVTDSKEYFDDFDLGITGSVGLNYRLASATWLSVDVSYLHGLTDVREDSKRSVQDNYLSGTNYKNRNLELNVGVNFGL